MLLVASFVVGWCAVDVARFLTSGDPSVVFELAGPMLAIVAAGCAVGWALTRPLAALLRLCAPLTGARLGFGAGILACVSLHVLVGRWILHFNVFLPLALAVLAASWLGTPGRRALVTLLALGCAAVLSAQRALSSQAEGRPDLPPAPAAAAQPSPNLVLIVLDTVRADRLAPYGHAQVTTPGLDAFAREHATVFEQARATSSWTLPSHASMLTGLLPAEHGADHPRGAAHGLKPGVVRAAAPLRSDVPTLAELLRARGYRTGAVVANSAYLDYRFGLDRGFQHYDDRPGSYVGDYRALVQMLGFNRRAGQLIYRDARQISEAALAWLGSGSEPFFLLLNFMDAHSPCWPPREFKRDLEQVSPEHSALLQAYDGSLRYIDHEVMRVIDRLRERGWFEGTALIVTSDHGEAFGEHDYWDHAWTLYDELLRVPLYVKPPGVRTRAREARSTSLREVFGLALELTRTPVPSDPRPDLPLAEWYRSSSNPVIRRWAERVGRDLESDLLAWVEGGVKYIVASNGDIEAYDLARDPGERDPLALSPEQQAQALATARAWWAAHPPLMQVPTELDPETQARMQALGYAGE